MRGFVDEHLACEAGEGAEVGVSCAPVVVGLFGHGFCCCCRCGGSRRREVVQQSGFGAHTGADDFLESSSAVAVEFGDAVAVTAAGDKTCYVDDEPAEFFESGFKAWQDVFARPDVGRDHFDDTWVELAGFGLKSGVMDWIGVVGTLESIVAAVR